MVANSQVICSSKIQYPPSLQVYAWIRRGAPSLCDIQWGCWVVRNGGETWLRLNDSCFRIPNKSYDILLYIYKIWRSEHMMFFIHSACHLYRLLQVLCTGMVPDEKIQVWWTMNDHNTSINLEIYWLAHLNPFDSSNLPIWYGIQLLQGNQLSHQILKSWHFCLPQKPYVGHSYGQFSWLLLVNHQYHATVKGKPPLKHSPRFACDESGGLLDQGFIPPQTPKLKGPQAPHVHVPAIDVQFL